MTAEPKAEIKRVPRATYVRALRARIRTFERRYELSSEEMRWAVRKGLRKETHEIAKWLQDYQILDTLTATNGTRTKTTNASMSKS